MNADKFEYVIAQMSGDRAYLGKIVDSCDPEYFQNKDIKVFMTKILEFFKKRLTVPNREEVKVMCDDKLIYHTDKGETRVYDDNGLNERIAYTDMTMSGVNVVPADEAHNLLHSFKNAVNRIVYCSIDPKRMYDYIENSDA